MPIVVQKPSLDVVNAYAWGGTDIARLCNLLIVSGQSTAEIKFFFDVPGREYNPPLIFSKLLGKNSVQPQIVYLGFNRDAMECFFTQYADKTCALRAFKKEITDLCIQERMLVTELCQRLTQGITTTEEFVGYQVLYEQWVSRETRCDWGDSEALQVPAWLQKRVYCTDIFDALRRVRQKMVKYLNKIVLEPGMVILSPVGYLHSIVGSLQTHPPAEHPDAKTEAWVVCSIGANEQGVDTLLYYEPQQRPQGRDSTGKPKRKDVTYSLIDWPTPIIWDTEKSTPKLRKNLCENLDALLALGEKPPVTECDALKLLIDCALHFEPTQVSDFLVNQMPGRIHDVTAVYPAAYLTRVTNLINGTYKVMKKELFQLHEIVLAGKGDNDPARITVLPQQDCEEQLVVLPIDGAMAGAVSLIPVQGERIELKQGYAAFITSTQDPYVLESVGAVRVMRLMFPAHNQIA